MNKKEQIYIRVTREQKRPGKIWPKKMNSRFPDW